jgi:hypothetical protein
LDPTTCQGTLEAKMVNWTATSKRHALSPVVEETSRDLDSTNSFSSFLQSEQSCSSASVDRLPSHPSYSYGSIFQKKGKTNDRKLAFASKSKHDNEEQEDVHQNKHASEKVRKYGKALLLCLAVCVVSVVAIMLSYSLPFFRNRMHLASFNGEDILRMSDLADVATTATSSEVSKSSGNFSFGGLALVMLPQYYATMMPALDIFNRNVMPGEIAKIRKVVLKTRDLMDVFSPVYRNSTKTGPDMWVLVRKQLAKGYQIVGEFLDLDHAHVMYSKDEFQSLRRKVLHWKKQFMEFDKTHDIPTFLSTGATTKLTTSFDHEKESRFYWLSGDHNLRPSGGDPATASLRVLGQIQLDVILTYLENAYPYISVLDEKPQGDCHNIRKALRAITDEYQIFGSYMFPMTNQTSRVMDDLNIARTLLGDIHDDWTAREDYILNHVYVEEQGRLAEKIDLGWGYFKTWVIQSDFTGSLLYLKGYMQN